MRCAMARAPLASAVAIASFCHLTASVNWPTSACAIAIVSPKSGGDYLVSVRVPRDCAVSAEAFCRTFPTGGGRRSAAGINHLPAGELARFSAAFEDQFRNQA